MRLNPIAALSSVLGLGVALVAGSEGQTPKPVIPNDPLFEYQFSFLNPGEILKLPPQFVPDACRGGARALDVTL
jgi:hypothetical protein